MPQPRIGLDVDRVQLQGTTQVPFFFGQPPHDFAAAGDSQFRQEFPAAPISGQLPVEFNGRLVLKTDRTRFGSQRDPKRPRRRPVQIFESQLPRIWSARFERHQDFFHQALIAGRKTFRLNTDGRPRQNHQQRQTDQATFHTCRQPDFVHGSFTPSGGVYQVARDKSPKLACQNRAAKF